MNARIRAFDRSRSIARGFNECSPDALDLRILTRLGKPASQSLRD